MKETLKRLESSLEGLDGELEHQEDFVLALREPVESLIGTPVETEVHGILAGAVSELEVGLKPDRERQESLPSEQFRSLRQRYVGTVDHHPALVLKIGRLADIFATLGL